MENKIAVIYKSKYGATKRYAGWIALKLDADLYELSDIRRKDLKAYDTIIYGGPLYIVKIKHEKKDHLPDFPPYLQDGLFWNVSIVWFTDLTNYKNTI